MEPDAERIRPGTFVGWGVLLVVIAVIATPVALWVGPESNRLVARLAGAIFAAAVLFRLAAAVRAAMGAGARSLGEIAFSRPQAPAAPDPLLARLGLDVQLSLRQRHHFVRVLWPRLEKIAWRRHARLPPDLPPRRGRPLRRDDLERILAALEAAE